MNWPQNIKYITLRPSGTGVSNLNQVAEKVKEDLGFALAMTALDADSMTQLTPDSVIAQGTAPHTVGFITGQNGADFVQDESGWITLIPHDLQRRHARHPPRPDRPSNRQMVATAEPGV